MTFTTINGVRYGMHIYDWTCNVCNSRIAWRMDIYDDVHLFCDCRDNQSVSASEVERQVRWNV